MHACHRLNKEIGVKMMCLSAMLARYFETEKVLEFDRLLRKTKNKNM